MIRIDHVSHQIGGAPVLTDIRADLPAGRLTGPNGVGKSTLLRLIGRLEPLQAGRISVAGLDFAVTPTARLARTMVILGQQTTIASRLRLSELIAFGRWPHHQGRPGADDHARALMARRPARADQGRSVVMVVHEINCAALWADHVVAPNTMGRHLGRSLTLHHVYGGRAAQRIWILTGN